MLLVPTVLRAEAADGFTSPPEQNFWQTAVMIVIAFVFFYVILWRPEQKRRKEAEKQRNMIKKGDRVVAMGILGTVYKVGDSTVILQMYDGSKIEVYKAAINEIVVEQKSEPDEKIS